MKMALIGKKLPYTMSPAVHQKILEGIGRQGSYGILEKTEEELPALFDMLRNGDYRGINVTIPYKTIAMQYMDELSPEVLRIGALNTVNIRDGRLTGYNTDYFGFAYALQKAKIDPSGKKACVLGAGGAAKAVAVYLKDAGADVMIASRDAQKIKEGFMGFPVTGYEKLDGDIIINTTPVGTLPDTESSVVSKDVLACFKAAADIVYNPRKTKFLQYAEELRMPYADGLFMLIAQAVKSEEIWQGMSIPQKLTERIAEEIG